MEVGQKVIFGRPNGEKTKGTIVKINKAKLKIRQDESRGTRPIGTIWTVPPSLCTTLDGKKLQSEVEVPFLDVVPDKSWILANKSKIEILANIYGALSPENLTCDGEASPSYVRQREAELNKKLQAAFILLDRKMSEHIVWQCIDIIENSKERQEENNLSDTLTEM